MSLCNTSGKSLYHFCELSLIFEEFWRISREFQRFWESFESFVGFQVVVAFSFDGFEAFYLVLEVLRGFQAFAGFLARIRSQLVIRSH